MHRSGPLASRSAAATSPMTICWNCLPCGGTSAHVQQTQLRKKPMSDVVGHVARALPTHVCSCLAG